MWYFAPLYIVLITAISFSGKSLLREALQIHFPLSKVFLEMSCRVKWRFALRTLFENNPEGIDMVNIGEFKIETSYFLSADLPRCSPKRPMIILAVIFVTGGKMQIPVQLSYQRRVPFFQILPIISLFHSLRKVSDFRDFHISQPFTRAVGLTWRLRSLQITIKSPLFQPAFWLLTIDLDS